MTFGQSSNTPKDLEAPAIYPVNLAESPAEDSVMSRMEAKKLGQEIYETSTSWLNNSRRSAWSNSLRAFQGLHPSGSKYLSADYKYRSRLYRPKTRAMVRKAEANIAAAFFSNEDVVALAAQNENDQFQQASAEIMQEILQYRLTKTIPWFLTLVGARQDADVMGICVGKVYWKYAEKFSHSEERPKMDPMGMPMYGPDGLVTETIDISYPLKDEPAIDLIAPENFRFDPAADWRKPVATSPYTIELIPMYVSEVEEKIEAGEWLPVSQSALGAATATDDDSTRSSRENDRTPGKDDSTWRVRPFDICWVRENIIRHKGEEIHFYSLNGTGELLTDPRPLNEVYLHGMRPYVAGIVVPEAHKNYPSGRIEIIRDLQTKANDLDNLRLDNVKLALNPRQFVSGGHGLDPNEVRKFMPGKALVTNGKVNIQEVIAWDRPPEVTGSAYAEQDRVDMDFDELVGGLSHATINANKGVFDAQGNTELLDSNAGRMDEYDMRVFTETFVEPIIYHLVKLEQAYETDSVVLTIAGQKAKLFQRYGMNEVTDELLKQDLTVKVNVGMGATNPKQKLNNFATAVQLLGNIYSNPLAAAGFEFEEVTKEIFGQSGYKDGMRFFKEDFDPLKVIQQMAGGNKKDDTQGKMQLEAMKIKGEAARQREQDQLDAAKNQQQHQYKMQEMAMQQEARERELQGKLWLALQQNNLKLQQEQQKAALEREDRVMLAREQREYDTSREVPQMDLTPIQKSLEGTNNAIREIGKLQIVLGQQLMTMRREKSTRNKNMTIKTPSGETYRGEVEESDDG